MTIARAKYIYIAGEFIKELAFVFDEKIIKIDRFEKLQRLYPDAKVLDFQEQIIMPGLINIHQHLEFSANQSSLTYGNFISWLHSVIEKRDDLMGRCDEALIEQKLNNQLRCGTTTIGEISSTGVDLHACAKAKQRVVFFNELIGSNPAMVDALYEDFNARVSASKAYASDKFYPALASIRPILCIQFCFKKL